MDPSLQELHGPGVRVGVRRVAGNAVRITHAGPGGELPPDPVWLKEVLPAAPEGAGEAGERLAELRAVLAGGCLQVETALGETVLVEARPPRFLRGGRLSLAFRIEPGEGFYGWGEWFNAFRRERGRLRLVNCESPSLLQGRRTYSTIPVCFSSRGYGLFFLNSYASDWRLDPEHGCLSIEAEGGNADYLVIYGPDFKAILQTYTRLTGRPPLLPRWAFGLWTTSYPQGPQERVLAHVREHRQRDIPLDAVILDYHWEAAFHNFKWRKELIPDPEGMIAGLKAQGVRLGLIFTPFLNTHNLPLQKLALQAALRQFPRGLALSDDRAGEEFAEARRRGYLAHERTRWWLGQGGMLDFSSPEAAGWWNARLRPLYEQGVSFFKNDDGEYLPAGGRSALGMDGREYHNLYGFFYGKAIYTGMAGLDGRRPLVYARSVWAGSQRYPALFLGDQAPSFECLRRTLRAGLNLSLLGFAYWTADVFGLGGKTTLETHMRYAQWALLSPIARYFWRPPEIDPTRLPWSHGRQAEANFRRYAELRYRLLPYYHTLAWQAYLTGLPILRPLVLEFPDNPRLAGVDDQALLGDRLLLAPVVEAGAVERRVRLPEGAWHDWWSDATWQGPGDILYPAPIDRLPILVRGGTILPMGPPLQWIPDGHRFARLQLHLWPPYPAGLRFYEDDGRTTAYQQGEYSVTEVSASRGSGRLIVQILPAAGGFPGQPEARQLEIVLHRSSIPQAVLVNGSPAPAWSYSSQDCETILALNCASSHHVTVEFLD